MLKIKDNVDLKELEKFGFEYEEGCYIKNIEISKKNNTNEISYEINYWIDENDKVLMFDITMYTMAFKYLDNTLYKLIKADFVEEVSNEN